MADRPVKSCGTCKHFKVRKHNRVWTKFYETHVAAGDCKFPINLPKKPQALQWSFMLADSGAKCPTWAKIDV